MNWNNFKLRRKFFIAFGIIILLATCSAIWAIYGVSSIVSDSESVIHGNNIRSELESKYIEHLLWTQKVGKLLTDNTQTELTVETDPHQCNFGKWYYGQGRNEAELLAPQLKPTFDEFEKPHNQLHESAVRIAEYYKDLDWELAVKIRQGKLDHIIWLEKVKDAIFIKNSSNIDVIKDAAACAFGIWVDSEELKEMSIIHPETKVIIANLREAHNKLHQSAAQAETYQRTGHNQQARNYFNSTITPQAKEVLSQIDLFSQWYEVELKDLNEADRIYREVTLINVETLGTLFNKAIHESESYIMTDKSLLKRASITRYGIFIFSIIVIGIAIAIALFITNSLVNPIKKAVKFANEVAAGDLTTTVDVNQNDEIGELATSLKSMVTRLNSIVSAIKTGADNISAASSQLSSGAQQVSSGVSEQAASAEEVSSSMEQMAANIQQNSENALKTRDITEKSSKAMTQVASASKESMDAVNDIYAKINMVVQIAEKTDLLAINAAVEAARAGDQGRGFAVVAAEVRKLAERSQLAASEIVALADRGLRMTKQSTDMLNSILPEIQKTAIWVDEIATASSEQEMGADQINSAIQQLSMVTQQNASAAEEMASSSEEMSSQAAELEEITRFFTVDRIVKNQTKSIKTKSATHNGPQTNGKFKSNKPIINLSGFDHDKDDYMAM